MAVRPIWVTGPVSVVVILSGARGQARNLRTRAMHAGPRPHKRKQEKRKAYLGEERGSRRKEEIR